MDKIYPYGETSGDFVDADVTNGIRGSKVPAKFFNDIQAEIIAAIEAAGLTPDGSKLTQLAEAIQAMASSGNADLSGYATEQYVDNKVQSVPSLGVDQAWYDVTDARIDGVEYINDTGKPIMVIAEVFTNSNCRIFVDGLGVGVVESTNNSSNDIFEIVLIVPDGSTYKYQVNSKGPFGAWNAKWELR